MATRSFAAYAKISHAAVASGIAAQSLLGCSQTDRTVTCAPASSNCNTQRVALLAPAENDIIFRSDRGQPSVGDLYTMDVRGGNLHRLTEGGDFYFPRWSPAGDSIACRWFVQDRAEVALLSRDGTPPVTLTQGEAGSLFIQPPEWSPDGQWIAFASARNGTMDMWKTSPSGSRQERWLAEIGPPKRTAIWSAPDGSDIAYMPNPPPGAAMGHGASMFRDIWLAPMDGSAEPVNLTQDRVRAPSFMRWSPDGTRIAFSGFPVGADGELEGVEDHEGGFAAAMDEIFVIRVDTGELTRLTHNDVVDHAPAWSPDGRSLLITSYRDGDSDVWLLPIDAPDEAHNLIDDGDFSQTEDHLADWYVPAQPSSER